MKLKVTLDLDDNVYNDVLTDIVDYMGEIDDVNETIMDAIESHLELPGGMISNADTTSIRKDLFNRGMERVTKLFG